MTTTKWTHAPACASRLDLPWTTDIDQITPWQAATMRAICGTCPAVFDCLAAVDQLDVTGGFWAGRDRDTLTTAPAPAPDFAIHSTSLAVAWVPVRSRRRSTLRVEQAVLTFDVPTAAVTSTAAAVARPCPAGSTSRPPQPGALRPYWVSWSRA